MSGAGDCAHALPRLPQEWPEVQQGLRRPWRKPRHSACHGLCDLPYWPDDHERIGVGRFDTPLVTGE